MKCPFNKDNLCNSLRIPSLSRTCGENIFGMGRTLDANRVNGHPELMTSLMDIDKSGDHWDQVVSSFDNEGRQPGTYPRISDTRAQDIRILLGDI